MCAQCPSESAQISLAPFVKDLDSREERVNPRSRHIWASSNQSCNGTCGASSDLSRSPVIKGFQSESSVRGRRPGLYECLSHIHAKRLGKKWQSCCSCAQLNMRGFSKKASLFEYCLWLAQVSALIEREDKFILNITEFYTSQSCIIVKRKKKADSTAKEVVTVEN